MCNAPQPAACQPELFADALAEASPVLTRQITPTGFADGELLGHLIGDKAADERSAARLIATFGSLAAATSASPEAICACAGGLAAWRLQLFRELARRVAAEPLQRRAVLSSWSAVTAYLRTVMAAETREQFRVLFLDKKNQLICDEVMGRGTVDHAPVYPREVVRRALELGASAMVVAHNHPSGDPTPSQADIDMTRQLVEAAKALSLKIHDHIIIGAHGCASLTALGLM